MRSTTSPIALIAALLASTSALAQDPAAGGRVERLETIEVVASTPLGDKTDPAKVPAAVQGVSADQIARDGAVSVTETLQRRIPSVSVDDTSGNGFQQGVTFRGFSASPVPGTPQGLAVYQNGVRINEAFGDVVNWDLIPTMAIADLQLVSNNPVFGLNALGGALTIDMKNGFTWQGAEVDTRFGSNSRKMVSFQYGKQVGAWAGYIASDLIGDAGWREHSASAVRRVFADIGYKGDSAEIHLDVTGAGNEFGAAATTPAQMLQQSWGSVYTTPQTTRNQLAFFNLRGRVDVSSSVTLQGNVYYRQFAQQHADGNTLDSETCSKSFGKQYLCQENDSFPKGFTSSQFALRDRFGNPIPIAILGGGLAGSIDRTRTRATSIGGSGQATWQETFAGMANKLVVGAALDRSSVSFSANSELGVIGPDLTVAGTGVIYHDTVPGGISEVSLATRNIYYGLFAHDTLDVTPSLSVTAGARLNIARIDLHDQLGTALNGGGTYTHINPAIGATYKLLPDVTAYAGFSESNRAPTPLELGCADPAHPCLIDQFLVSDPPLKQVVSRTVEAGLRGNHPIGADGGRLDWKLGVFQTYNDNDIISVPSTLAARGYYTNAGSTRRRGVEASIGYKQERWSVYAGYAMVDATFRSNLSLASPYNPFADANGNISVRPGNVMPGIPRHRLKAGADFAITPKWKVGADYVLTSSSYLQGDGANLLPKLPAYGVVNISTSYEIDKNFQIYGMVQNLFNKHYANAGGLFDVTSIPGLRQTDPRSLAPGAPLTAYVGAKVRF